MGYCCLKLLCAPALLTVAVSPLAAGDAVREKLTRQRLTAVTEIQNYPCAADYAWFFADSKLAECKVAREIAFGEITVPRGSWINLSHDGDPEFVFLAHDTNVNGYLCKGGGLLGPTEGASTALYPSGKLKTCWLANDTVVDSVPCAHASFWSDALGGNSGTFFHENGKLKSCQLAREFTLGDRVFHRSDHIFLDAAGRPTVFNARSR